jgi:mannose-6-phosphate isomerase-like protein (cupin superfamily)
MLSTDAIGKGAVSMNGAANEPGALRMAEPFDITGVKDRLAAGTGGYEVVHRSPGLEIGVYVLVAPEPDRQSPHEDDEVYVVLEGRGTLEVEGEQVELREGHAVFVPAGAEHRFVGYEQLSVLVLFEKWQR